MEQSSAQLPGLPLQPVTVRRSLVRRFFARGLAVLLPTLVTVIILLWAYQLLDNYLARHVSDVVKYVVAKVTTQPRSQVEQIWLRYHLGWVGVVTTLALVLLIGFVVGSLVGRWLWWTIEAILLRTPVIKQVYPYVKQVTDFLLSEQKLDFSQVVLAEYPRKGVWSMGFVVSRGFAPVSSRCACETVVVFIPSSPTPVTGYVIQLPVSEVIELNISVDVALRFVITCGVVSPMHRLGDRPTVDRLPAAPDPAQA